MSHTRDNDGDMAASIEFRAPAPDNTKRLQTIHETIALLENPNSNPDETLQKLNELAHNDPHIINNTTYKKRILAYQRDGNINDTLSFLREYAKVYAYCLGDAEEILNNSNRVHTILEFLRRFFNIGGIVSGEIISILAKIIHHIGPRILNIFQSISYISYGLTAFIYLVKTAYWLDNRNNKPLPDDVVPARPFVKSKIFSTIVNGLVFLAYLSVALILIGVPMPVGLIALKTGIAYSIAAVGTFLGWVGNNVINTWQAKKEYDDVTSYVETKLFSTIENFPEIVLSKQKKYNDEKTHRNYGIFMVIGMTLLALANLGPLLPVLAVYAPFIAKTSVVCMIGYAWNDICNIASGIVNKVSSCVKKNCCTGRNDSVDELSSRSPSPRQSQSPSLRKKLDSATYTYAETFGDGRREEKKRSPGPATPKQRPITVLPLTSPNSIFKPRVHTEKNLDASLDKRLFRVAKS